MADTSIGKEIQLLSRLSHRYVENSPIKAKIDSLTGANAWIMGYIASCDREGKDVYQKDIERDLKVTRSTASKVVNLMVKKGLIERESVPGDARLKKLVLTEKAKEIECMIASDFARIEEIYKQGFTEEEIEQFISFIHRVQKNIEAATIKQEEMRDDSN